MTPRRRGPGPAPDRWLISYADFITLLFALFVVLYAVAQNDQAKPSDVAASVQRAFGGPTLASKIPPTPGQLAPSYAHLNQQLQQEIADGKMQVAMDARGIIITLHEGAFFPSGGDTIYPAAFASLTKVGDVLRDLPNAVRLEGHTDSVPIHTQRFRSNWDLSAARAIAVMEFFATHSNIAPLRFAIAGYADNLPVAENDSDEGRSKNRRVDIVIVGTTQTGTPARKP